MNDHRGRRVRRGNGFCFHVGDENVAAADLLPLCPLCPLCPLWFKTSGQSLNQLRPSGNWEGEAPAEPEQRATLGSAGASPSLKTLRRQLYEFPDTLNQFGCGAMVRTADPTILLPRPPSPHSCPPHPLASVLATCAAKFSNCFWPRGDARNTGQKASNTRASPLHGTPSRPSPCHSRGAVVPYPLNV